MTSGSQKMIVGNQKPPSIIFQQRRLGEFCFAFYFVPLNGSFLFVWGFLACKLFIHRQYALNQPSIKKQYKGWRMVKSETGRDAEILVRNPSPRLFRDSKKV